MSKWQQLEAEVRALLEAAQERRAVTRVIEVLGPDVLEYLRTRLDEDDAQEALSRWAEEVWKSLKQFRWEGSLRGWAYKLAKRSLLRVLRQPWRNREDRLASSMISRLPASLGSSSGAGTDRQRRFELLRTTLEPDDQELLTLRVDRELEWEESAEVLERTSVTLRKRYERLIKKLRALAEDQNLID